MAAQWEGAAGERILVVEDDPDYRALLELGLRREGHDVCAVGSAKEALDALPEFRPSLLITDIKMPGMSGLDLCRQLRSSGEWRHLPIVLLSGAEDSASVGEVAGLGLIWYLRKGVEWAQLHKTVRNLVTRAYPVPEVSRLG
ncbi:MAG TPA: response regulator [Candidatus Sulfotelmatobacter sp.]|nr:response regulator [Candidatus Sulfotelmatobacter sp.]